MATKYVDADSAVEAVLQAVSGCKFRVRLDEGGLNVRYPSGRVVNAAGEPIGDASSYTYGGGAFAIHTREYAGYAPFDQCEFV